MSAVFWDPNRYHVNPPPPGWEVADLKADGVLLIHRTSQLTAIVSRSRYSDGHIWVHLSVSHPKRVPTWAELVSTRDRLLGEDIECYQVAPPKERYVNLHPRVLHLYGCEEGPVLPQFDEVRNGVRTI